MPNSKKANLRRAKREQAEDNAIRGAALVQMHQFGFRSWNNADCITYRRWIRSGMPLDSNGKPLLTGITSDKG